jgi:LysR family hydrogen peroxide-inducible transcriptional activator
MNLRDLEYAVSLAIDGRFGRAAERCHVSQPTLSAQLAKLEDELGVQLFERGARVATPTVGGRVVLQQAKIVLDEVERLKELARATRDPLAGPLHLGVIQTVGPYLMPRLLPLLRRSYPALKLLLHEERTAALLARLRAGALDAAILSLPLDGEDLRWETLLVEPILLAVPRDHRLARQAEIAHAALADEALMLIEDGHCLREQTLGFCHAAGIASRRDVQGASLETLRQLVMADIGIGLMPELATLPPFGAGPLAVYRPFAAPVPSREIVLVWRRSFPRGDAFKALARQLATELAAVPMGG